MGSTKPIEITDEWCKRVATLYHRGDSITAINEAMNISSPTVRKILADNRTIDYLKVLTEAAYEQAKELFQANIRELTVKAIAKLHEELEHGTKNGLEAAKTVLKAGGILDQDNNAAQDTSFTIVMPNSGDTAIEIPNQKIVDSHSSR